MSRYTGEIIKFRSKGETYIGHILNVFKNPRGIYTVGVKYDELPRYPDLGYKVLDGQPWRFFTISEGDIIG